MKAIVVLFCVVCLVGALANPTFTKMKTASLSSPQKQNGASRMRTESLALGTVSNVKAATCPSSFYNYKSMSCQTATVSCPNTANIGVTFGLLNNAAGKGTIVLHGGGGGTAPFGTTQNFAVNYYNGGYSLIQLEWASAWEDTGLSTKSVLAGACRPATLVNFFHSGPAVQGKAYCYHGHSGGSGAGGYALAQYGLKSILDKVVLSAGPVFSNISAGCVVPNPPQVTVCPAGQAGCNGQASFLDTPTYQGSAASFVQTITGDSKCAGTTTTTQAEADAWEAMSIVAPGGDFAYLNTAVSQWQCYPPTNNSPSQGQLFASAVLATGYVPPAYLFGLVSGCTSSEDVWDGTYINGQSALTAIVNDMIDPVDGCILRH